MDKKIETSPLPDLHGHSDFEHAAHRECLEILYRQTPGSIIAHLIASGLTVFALMPVVDFNRLVIWSLMVLAVSVARLTGTLICLARWPVPDRALSGWQRILGGLALLQMLVWGLSVVFIWPDELAYRVFMVVVLAGVMAAGGIILAIQRFSYLIYCFPILIPTVWQLFADGERLEATLALLMILYAVMLIIAVNRLGNNYIEGLVLRLRMQALSKTDSLTGLANRRGFDEYLASAWQNAIRSSQSIGLIIADIDFFKAYNDAYGHPQGDEALKELAKIFHRIAGRGTDICARVGGEEFAIILPSTDLDGTHQIAEQIMSALDESAIEHVKSPVGHLTISIGMHAIEPTKSSDLKEFYSEADKALYAAKNAGKNRIEAASGKVWAR